MNILLTIINTNFGRDIKYISIKDLKRNLKNILNELFQ